MGKFMTVSQVADMLTLSVQQVYRLAQTRQIPHVRIGGRLFFNPAAVDLWIEEHTVDAKA